MTSTLPLPSAAQTRPRVPLTPTLSGASFRMAGGARLPSVREAGQARLVTSGRIALGLALRALGVGQGDVVLLPAYRSLSMVPPVLWLNATPRFYRVDAQARADLDDIAALCDGTVRALVVTHYFGFPQALVPLRALCDARGIALIEDCAHAFFGDFDGKPPGAVGDYAIASTMKFYPAYDGGCLVSARHALDDVALRSAGKGFEIKAALATLEYSFNHGRLAPVRALLTPLLRLKDVLWGRIKARRPQAAALAPGSSDSDASFDPAWLDKRASWCSRLLLACASARRIVALRRHHYQRLNAALAHVPGCRPLFPALPDGVCPWLFPLVVDDADAVFSRLVAAGVPVVRFAERLWPGMDPDRCPHSQALSRRVLSFPCHQELTDVEVDWLIASIAASLSPAAMAAPAA